MKPKKIICPECKKECLNIHYFGIRINEKYPTLIGYAAHRYTKSILNIVSEKCDFTKDWRMEKRQ